MDFRKTRGFGGVFSTFEVFSRHFAPAGAVFKGFCLTPGPRPGGRRGRNNGLPEWKRQNPTGNPREKCNFRDYPTTLFYLKKPPPLGPAEHFWRPFVAHFAGNERFWGPFPRILRLFAGRPTCHLGWQRPLRNPRENAPSRMKTFLYFFFVFGAGAGGGPVLPIRGQTRPPSPQKPRCPSGRGRSPERPAGRPAE